MFNIAVLISGSGTNLQAVIDATQNGSIESAKVALVVSNRDGVYGLQRAIRHKIPNFVIPKTDPAKLLDTLRQHDIHAIVLAGYLSVVPPEVVSAYPDRIINIHPALLPMFGGMGYYGIRVHEAVIDSGVKHSGATAHIVDTGVDTGAILVQCEVPVLPKDTPQILQKRVLKTEHKVLVRALRCLVDGEVEAVKQKPIILKPKRVLVIGNGGREHAIGWKLSQNPDAELYFAPGNGGTCLLGENIDITVTELDRLADFAKNYNMYLTVVGPELPLTLGIADVFRKRGLRIFAPDLKGAQLEGSKAFAKQFMRKYNIPTAAYDEVTDINEGIKIIDKCNFPVVIKADGLAAGKGVVICNDRDEAEKILLDMLEKKAFGDAGSRVVIEEYLIGCEVSLLCFTDSKTIIPMETASDYKRALDNDMGLNTGGMGSISPSPYATPAFADYIAQNTLKGIINEGFDYRGVIYIGLMLTAEGPKVLEFNTRFGDPETEALLPRLKSDLLSIIDAVVDKKLETQTIDWYPEHAVCVVMASEGYPGNYETGFEITIPDDISSNCIVFHAGTSRQDGAAVTSGGRVLALTALGSNYEDARDIVYENIKRIIFKGNTYRTDIGL